MEHVTAGCVNPQIHLRGRQAGRLQELSRKIWREGEPDHARTIRDLIEQMSARHYPVRPDGLRLAAPSGHGRRPCRRGPPRLRGKSAEKSPEM
jgi:hypothetical protein